MTDPRMTPTNDAPVTVEQCPFCGGRARLDRYDPDSANPEMAVNCMGECDGIFIFPKIAADDTVALVQRWNTRLAALASAPAGDEEMQRILHQLDEAQAWTGNHEDGGDDPFQDQQQLLLDAAALIRSLARPRAAVGERLHEAVVTLDVFLSAYEDRGDAELVERDHNDDLLTYGHLRTILSALALQSPPAKVEQE